MKNFLKPFTSTLGAIAIGTLLAATTSRAANYAGNLNTGSGFGGAVANGVLSVTDDGTNITVNLQRGVTGNLDNLLVIYIDTGVGGYTDTSTFTDTGGPEQRAISGYQSSRSLMTFTNGFKPSYAVAIKSDYMDLWSLANPASLSYITGASQGGDSSANFTLTFSAAQIGLAPNVSTNIRIFGTFISDSGYRSTEAIAGNDAGVTGWNPFSQTAFGTYYFDTVVPTLSVNFSVDMTAELSSNYFNLGNNFNPATDTVYCGGSFQSSPFTFANFQLTNNPSATGAATNIYYGTYLTTDLTNTLETYKFKYTHVVTGVSTNDIYDEDPNRSFMLASNNQAVPLVYFDDIAASPSATTNNINFVIDMSTAIALGTFTPANGDLIEVFGTFEAPRWSGNFPPIGYLTNNPSSATPNVYSGTFADGNYPGTQHQYRYAIVTTTPATIYENLANRTLVTPNGTGTLPTNYFSGISSIYSNNITFEVDMTVPILAGLFNPGAGDVVYAAGSFQTNTWTPGAFALTNQPTSANTNIYYGTYADVNTPGINEFYKFVMITNTASPGTNYENDPNRTFLLGSSPQTNPVVFWNNVNTNEVMLTPTTVTFWVNMNGAVDIYGNPFDHDNDLVFINGDFTTPAWPDFWQDPFINDDYPQNIMVENPPGSLIYSNTFVVPAGSPLYISYKYGIRFPDVISGTDFNTNVDNEAPAGNDHHRYVRASGSYNFPVDIFGINQTNEAAATEPVMGNLAIGNVTAGKLPITWLGGLSGVRLQTTTNLMDSASWQDITNTDGASQTNWPTGSGSLFFRLHNTR